jgi:uncharacterized protein YutE (UPF0331/DUF86 family)
VTPARGRPDAAVLDAKLAELSRRLKRIEAKRPSSLKALSADEDLQDILARNLEVSIQNCVDIALHLCAARGTIPPTSALAFAALADLGVLERGLAQRMQRAVGFRNVLAHEYAEVDWKIVMQVLRTGTGDLRDFGRAVLAVLEGG